MLPRFCDQSLERSRKADLYPQATPSLARQARHDRPRALSHRSRRVRHPPRLALRRHRFAALARAALLRGRRRDGEGLSRVGRRSRALRLSRRTTSPALTARHGGVVATTFRNFPSFPQRYMEPVDMPAADPLLKVEPLKPLTQPVLYTEDDLAHPPVHRGGAAPADPQGTAPGGVSAPAGCCSRHHSTRLIPTNRSRPVARSRGARPAPPRTSSARARTRPRRRDPDMRRARARLVLKNTRSPGRSSAPIDAGSRRGYCSATVRGTRDAVLREHVPDEPAAIEPVRDRCRRSGTARPQARAVLASDPAQPGAQPALG